MAIEPWLRLLAAVSPGSRSWVDLLGTYGSASAVIELSAAALASAGVDTQTLARLEKPDEGLLAQWRLWLDQPDRALLTLGDPGYPARLAECPDAPLALWVEGARPALLDGAQLAIVGSRNPTAGGRETARAFARYLSERGLTITSGLATGIDAASHTGALEGGGGTIAVLGTGLDSIYPRSNAGLAQDIKAAGLLVSEYPPGTQARPHHFPQRNRIIAALSLGTLVVEASRESGSLITARRAAEYGREVFAIPGSIRNPLAKGCHVLIREGAKLVDDTADILLEIAPQLVSSRVEASPVSASAGEDSLTKRRDYVALLEALEFAPTGIAQLAERAGLTTAEVSSMLLVLELEGLVEALPGGRYARLAQRD